MNFILLFFKIKIRYIFKVMFMVFNKKSYWRWIHCILSIVFESKCHVYLLLLLKWHFGYYNINRTREFIFSFDGTLCKGKRIDKNIKLYRPWVLTLLLKTFLHVHHGRYGCDNDSVSFQPTLNICLTRHLHCLRLLSIHCVK